MQSPYVTLSAEARLQECIPWFPLFKREVPGARVKAQNDRVVPTDSVGDVLTVTVFHASVWVVQVGDVAVDAVCG